MKTIIAGSRLITDYSVVKAAVEESGFKITEVVSGTASGIDRLGEQWAEEQNIPIKRFPAQWKKFGKSAGVIRNKEMGEYADAAIIIWDGVSKGTKNMIDIATALKLKMFVIKKKGVI